MSTFYEVVQNYLTPYYWYFLIFFSIIIFGLLGKYAYDKYYVANYEDGKKDFTDVANAEIRDREAYVYFFYVDWCPHCKTALPDWIKFKNQYNGETVNKYTITCVEMNCTEESAEITEAINKYDIKGYPTVKMSKDDKIIEFDAKISYNSLEKFVQMMTKP
jgi:thiol-disulfide isomerase/thioredoxin